jgi:NADPH-dependent 2,4-dienoyl-CoA reductase/sulfur reductase-like enzyme
VSSRGEKIVVVGGNAAGLTAASRARRLDPRLEITVLERAPHAAYSTCGIPYFLAGDVDQESLVRMTPADFQRERQIEVLTSVRVDEVAPSRRRILATRTDTGEAFEARFDRLLLATGVVPNVPEIPGTDLPGVHTLVGLTDALRLAPELEGAAQAGIVGAGYVGLEMAEALIRLGKKVTLFEGRDRVLPGLDADMARIVEYELRRNGVRVHTHQKVTALAGDGDRVRSIHTGRSLGSTPVDVVLLDTGVRPNVELARSAGVRTGEGGGIVVDPWMETNLPGIFAAGNCTEAFSRLHARAVPGYLGTVAAKQGRVAGENLAGRRTQYAGSVGTIILKAFDLAIGKTGLSSDEAQSERIPFTSARIEALDRAAYFPGAGKIWLKVLAATDNHRLLGLQGVGYGDVARRLDVAATALTSGMTLEELANLDLTYTPPFGSLWDPLHRAAQAALRNLSSPG